MMEIADIQGAIAALQREFDAGFAAPICPPPPDLIPLLVVRLAGVAHALPLADLQSFIACGALVRLPRQAPACLGLAAFRGRPIPVYSLASLLGHHAQDAAPRWLAVSHDGIAFAVAALVGLVRVRADDLRHHEGASGRPMVALPSGHCPLINLRILVPAAAQSDGHRIP